MLRTAVKLFVACAALSAQDEKTGQIRLIYEDGTGKPGKMAPFEVYRADDPLADAESFETQLRSGPFSVPGELKADLVRTASEKNTAVLTLPPGSYHVRIDFTGGAALWVADQRVAPGSRIEHRLQMVAPGSLKGVWSVDKSVQPNAPMEASYAALVRDGRVWAVAKDVRDKTFEMRVVPPGTYTLVLQDAFEKFIWFKEDVRILEGRETTVSVEVKRNSLGGLVVHFVDKATGKELDIPRDSRLVLVDTRRRFAVRPNFDELDRRGFLDIPLGTTYVLRASVPGYKAVEKGGLMPRGPAVSGKFEAIRVELTPSK